MREVSVTEVPKTAQLIDVREPEEFAEVHALGAINIPMGEVISNLDKLDKDQDLYLICKSGGRSKKVGEYLVERGFDPINVAGGTEAWVEAGLETA